MAFIEERLIDSMSHGFSGGPTWNTTKVSLRSGITRRGIRRSRPLHRFVGSFDFRDDGILDTLLDAFNATMGAAYSFRFKNWLDYKFCGDPLGAATGGMEIIQLVRVYTFGNNITTVPIKKPNDDITIYQWDGADPLTKVEVSSVVDTTTGLVTVTADAGSELMAFGTFDLPVMFENDEFLATVEAYKFNSIDIQLTEDLSV